MGVASRRLLSLLFAYDLPWPDCAICVTCVDFKDGSCLLFINVINGTVET